MDKDSALILIATHIKHFISLNSIAWLYIKNENEEEKEEEN